MIFRDVLIGLRAIIAVAFGAASVLAWNNGFPAAGLVALIFGVMMAASAKTRSPLPRGDSNGSIDHSDAAERRRMTAYLDLSPAPLISLDGYGRLWTINRAARQLFKSQDLIAAPPDGLARVIAQTQPGSTGTIDLPAANGTNRVALSTADLDTGSARRRVAALIDIDAQLKVAEATALRELLQVLSHEIMNALTPIASLGRTASDILADERPDLPAARGAVETIARRATSLHRFSTAYRELARLPQPTLRLFELSSFVSDLEQLFASRWGSAAQLTIDLEKAPDTIKGDADQLTNALWAILQNAVEAVDGSASKVTLVVVRDAVSVVFRIADNGPGISGGVLPNVFQPFYTTKPDGSGVGLPFARQVFRTHGGDVRLIARKVSEGACFEARLPVN